MHINCEGNWVRLPFLLDTGAQCSIIDFSSINKYNIACFPAEKPLVSLRLMKNVQGYSYNAKIMMPNLELRNVDFFCIPSLKLTMSAKGISNTIKRLSQTGIPLSTNLPEYTKDSIKICGILGNDVLQHFSVFELENIFNGKMLRLCNGYVPIGSVGSLLAEVRDCKYTCASNVSKTNLSHKNDCIALNNKFSDLSADVDTFDSVHTNFKVNNNNVKIKKHTHKVKVKESSKNCPNVDTVFTKCENS